MAINRFINVDGGEWNTAANWLLDDDGVTARVPLNTDDVVITTSLNASKTITVTTTAAVCKSADFSTAGNAFTFSGAPNLTIYGSLTCKTGMTWSYTGRLTVGYTAAGILTSNSVSLAASSSVRCVSTNGSLTLADALVCGPLYISGAGTTFSTGVGNNAVTCTVFGDISTAGTVTLTLGSSIVNCTNVFFATATITVTTNTAAINITSTADITANFGGKIWGGTITCLLTAGKKLTLGDSPTFGNFVWSQGTFELNGKTLTCDTFNSSNTNTRIIQDTPTTGKIILTGLTGTVFNVATVTSLTISDAPTIDIGTSNLTLTGDVTFAGGGKTFGNFKVSKHAGDFDCIVTGANTFGSITLETPDATYQFSHLQLPAGVTTTCTSFVSDGTATYQNSLLSSSAAAHTLSDTAGTNTLTYTTVAYSQAEGGATWNALTSAGNLDGGNNTGWVFTSSGSLIGSLMLMGIGR